MPGSSLPGAANEEQAVHATAVVVGEAGVLIRGAPGTGKSELAAHLVGEACRRGLFARLIGDDRVILTRAGSRIVMRPHPRIAGLLEKRWEAIAKVPYEPAVVLRCVVDLFATSDELPLRLPGASETSYVWREIVVSRLVLPDFLSLDRRIARILDFLGAGLPINSPNLDISPLPIDE
ncbi:MAG: hypothetical protein KDJ29_03970 [Hyphomicrobiales bacterium]|nr:hypothetical protein [Hyphomicrobiales bacterium]